MQKGERCTQEDVKILILIWMYVFSGLEIEQVIQGEIWKTCYSQFDALASQKMIKTMGNDNTHVLELPMFNDKTRSIIFKLLGVVVYWILYKYIFTYYLCIHK